MDNNSKKFLRLPLLEKGILIRTALLLAIINLGIRIYSFRRIQKWLIRSYRPPTMVAEELNQFKHNVVRSINRMGPRLPWKNTCLTQALVGQFLLSREGIPTCLKIGVDRNDKDHEFLAHAWLESGDVVLIGGEDSPKRYFQLKYTDGRTGDFYVG